MKNPINLKLSVSVLLLVLLTFCTDDDPIQYQLETSCIPEETGTVTPLSGMYNEGSEIELKATPIDEYIFKNWTGDASGNANPLKVIMLEDKNITAVFEKVDYALTLDVIGEGTVNQEIVLAKSSSTDYESGTTVQLTAVPDADWKFVEWSGDHTSTENPIQLKMDQAMTITAKFEKVSYSLAIEIKGNGTVNEVIIQAKSASTDYESGTTVQLTAVPEDQWGFVGWSGDYEGAENPIQITIDKPMSIVATFEEENLEKTYVPDDNFEKALIAHGYDEVLDDYVYTKKIKNIEELRIENKGIEDLTGIEGFENLITLVLTNNNLTYIDISKNLVLESLICDKNQLTNLDVSQNSQLAVLITRENQLSCIQVSEIQLVMTNNMFASGIWWFADEGVIYSIDCDFLSTALTYIPDDNFEQALIDLGLDDILDDYVLKLNILNVIELNISNRNISDMTGLEDFERLITLVANDNNISSIPLDFGIKWGPYPPSPWAGNLDLSNNNLSELNISKLNFFRTLDVRNNPLTCIVANENQLSYFEDSMENVQMDEGVIISLDCEN